MDDGGNKKTENKASKSTVIDYSNYLLTYWDSKLLSKNNYVKH